ncbi:(3R)-hydroxymyristoyl ACP dehydrase, putative [Eimeria tenella]|uniref:(3R)-hydroxymyristoyl ACP dehydrase, putative n=1 Tax=Eimeria tenella TaxID=5802 RepID=U6L604_EIMTE|nr:(3R)-hydroxymyristoyl ACP dehydrase, putative [Eimeria tenella]CDJ43999.1 (3R)-hydroxymyristoyl ACP dehydrase, putative [Eimeria tenella]|eukprot:XP_013234748.1 (3R)-hydroxymyristoyl ACP dehydrase, putative [Eimeria tenella]
MMAWPRCCVCLCLCLFYLPLCSLAFTIRSPSSLQPGAAAAAAAAASPLGAPATPAAAAAAAAGPAAAARASSPLAAADSPAPAAAPSSSSGSSSGSSSSSSSSYRDASWVSSLTSSVRTPAFTAEQIKQILPHRYPFLLVDKVVFFEAGKRAVGVKNISNNENQFNGHFPERAVMPGVLQVEALAQLAGVVALQPPLSDGKGIFFFAGANGVKWKKPVLPGDSLVMEAELVTWKEKFGIAKFKGRGFVDGQLAVEVEEMTFAFGR